MIVLFLGLILSLSPEEQQKSIDNWNKIAAARPGATAAKKKIAQINKENKSRPIPPVRPKIQPSFCVNGSCGQTQVQIVKITYYCKKRKK